jgi:hypothetical protein
MSSSLDGRAPFRKTRFRATLGTSPDVTCSTASEVGMAAQDAVGATREALTSLAAAVLRVRSEYGDTLGVRRLTSDVDRLAEALDQIGEPQPGHRPGVRPDELVEIPDDPYDESMWQDAQSETQHAQ